MFRGRYGFDGLCRLMIYTALGLSLIALFFRNSGAWYFITGASTVLIILAALRAFSRNFDARQRENEAYLNVAARVKGWWNRTFSGARRARKHEGPVIDMNELKKYKHLTCPHCGQKLRVPRGKGKLRVTCRNCGKKFDAKS